MNLVDATEVNTLVSQIMEDLISIACYRIHTFVCLFVYDLTIGAFWRINALSIRKELAVTALSIFDPEIELLDFRLAFLRIRTCVWIAVTFLVFIALVGIFTFNEVVESLTRVVIIADVLALIKSLFLVSSDNVLD